MDHEFAAYDAPTRHEYVKYGGGLLAGCTGGSGFGGGANNCSIESVSQTSSRETTEPHDG